MYASTKDIEDGWHSCSPGLHQHYVNGYIHRLDGPAVINSHRQTEFWFRFGMLHREDGPAMDYSIPADSHHVLGYYLNNKRYYVIEDWARQVLGNNLKPTDDESVRAFLQPIITKQVK